jgi:hypothetical protein
MRKVLLASVALVGLAATPLMAQTTLNSNDSVNGSVNTPAGGAGVRGGGSLSGSGGDIDKNSRSGGASSGTYNRDPSLATVPDRDDANKGKQMRDNDRDHNANSARPYAPGQMKKDQ